jgi:hypothetical protein
LQVLGGQGLIKRAPLEQYMLKRGKDAITGMVDLYYSLQHLLAECHDFNEEETALQYLGSQLGVVVNLMPKFHAKLAGEGVDYSWAHVKAFYRRMPLSRKRGCDNFKQLVKDCTCPENVLTKRGLRSLHHGRGHTYALSIILNNSSSKQLLPLLMRIRIPLSAPAV